MADHQCRLVDDLDIFTQIKINAFFNELEKDASWKSKLVGAGMVGAIGLSGLGIGNIAGTITGMSSANQGFNLAKQEQGVPTSNFVKQYAPNVQVINSNDLDTVQGINPPVRAMLKQELKRGNMFHQIANPGKNPERIIAPDTASPTMLSHEVGHHFERQAHPGWRPNIMREVGAWKMAPKVNNQFGSQMQKKLFGSYVHQTAGQGGGLLGGSLLGGLFAGVLKRKRMI